MANMAEQPIQFINARNMLLNTINPSLSLFDIRRLNPTHILEYELELVYLHLKIIFGEANEIDNFLHNYCERMGIHATNMFVNFPLIDIENNQNMTPFDCATIWNTNIEKQRILYKWGADISMPNVNGNYIGDDNLVPYRNYLSRFVLRENIHVNNYPRIRGYRMEEDFADTCQELAYLSGERNPPDNWSLPHRILQNPLHDNYHPLHQS